MNKLAIIGNGCIRENAQELKFLKDIKEFGITRSSSLEEADYVLYITCAGVGDTIKKCLKDIACILKYKEQNQKLIIVGCLSALEGLFDDLNNRNDIKVINNIDWNVEVYNYILEQKQILDNKMILENRTRFFFGNNVSIQFFLEKGCINNCSFCKINYADMPVESVPYDLAMKYLKDQIKNGTRIINLSGENLTLYGLDLYGKQILHTFIRELSEEPNLVTITVNEITVSNMYNELLEELSNNHKVRSVGIQLESASDRILSLMNRNHNMQQFDYIVNRLQSKNKFISTLLMSGFPTETYEDIDVTIKYMRDKKIFSDGICQYVDFEYIPSSSFEQLSKSEKRAHTMYLRKAILENNFEILNDYMDKMNYAVLAGKVDGHYIIIDSPKKIGLSKSKKYDNIEIGSIIQERPKCLVHKSKFSNTATYKY